MSVIASAVAASSGRLVATMPPNAETLSQARASFQASRSVSRVATPHGLACLTMTMVEIVVAELLALHLLGLRDAASGRADGDVERRGLVRIFAVAKTHLERRGEGPVLGPA
jgi:hypothetical protein